MIELVGEESIFEGSSNECSFYNKTIAFITAIYGNYESSCKRHVKQTIPADFICFSNNPNIIANNWEVDILPYFITNPSNIDDGSYINSLQNNNHTFNIAKYFKQSFHNIPRLKNYDIVIWLDGSIEIKDPKAAEWVENTLKKQPMIVWEHDQRKGSLESEMEASAFIRYTSTSWLGQVQPYQNVQAQYKAYISDGYDEGFWKRMDPLRANLGVWITCFVAFDNKNEDTHKFLDFWYLQTLKYSTQDQVSFSYAVQKLAFYPYTLPDSNIKGKVGHNSLFYKHAHGR